MVSSGAAGASKTGSGMAGALARASRAAENDGRR